MKNLRYLFIPFSFISTSVLAQINTMVYTEFDSLKSGKVIFSDSTELTTAPETSWIKNPLGIHYLDGNVGINETNPSELLILKSDTSSAASLALATDGIGRPFIKMEDGIGDDFTLGYDGGSYVRLRSNTGTWFTVLSGTGRSATQKYVLSIHNNGNVSIGTSQSVDHKLEVLGGVKSDTVLTNFIAVDTTYIPSGYSVAINGNLIAEEVDVVLSQNWPDYVFDEGYKLKSLEDTKEYVQLNKHLPGTPSKKEMEEKGVINLEKMNLLLLEKVEELTLHLIDQNEKIKTMQDENEKLQMRVQKLESTEN